MAHGRRQRAMRAATRAIDAHHRARERLCTAREAVDRQVALVASCDEQIAAMTSLRDKARGSSQQRAPDEAQRFVQSLHAQALSGTRTTLDQRYVPTPELKRMQAALQERAQSFGQQYRRQLVRAEAERQHLENEYRAALAEHIAGMQDPPARRSGEHCSAANTATPEPGASGCDADAHVKVEGAASPDDSSEYTSASSASETDDKDSAGPAVSARPPAPPLDLAR